MDGSPLKQCPKSPNCVPHRQVIPGTGRSAYLFRQLGRGKVVDRKKPADERKEYFMTKYPKNYIGTSRHHFPLPVEKAIVPRFLTTSGMRRNTDHVAVRCKNMGCKGRLTEKMPAYTAFLKCIAAVGSVETEIQFINSTAFRRPSAFALMTCSTGLIG